MNGLLALSRGIDSLNDRLATFAKWAVFASCLISAATPSFATSPTTAPTPISRSSGTCSPACVMLGASQVLRVNEHIRVDVIYGRYRGARRR